MQARSIKILRLSTMKQICQNIKKQQLLKLQHKLSNTHFQYKSLISNKPQSESRATVISDMPLCNYKNKKKAYCQKHYNSQQTSFPGMSPIGHNGSCLLYNKGSICFYRFAVENPSYLTINQNSKIRILVELQYQVLISKHIFQNQLFVDSFRL